MGYVSWTLLGGSLVSGLVLLASAGCGKEEVTRPEGWTEETHGNAVDPAYDVVFSDTSVGRLDITVSAADWQRLVDQMTEQAGAFGQETGGGDDDMTPPPGDDQPPGPDTTACNGLGAGDTCSTTLEGVSMEGSCTSTSMGMACVPTFPEEATTACAQASLGDVCSYLDEAGLTVEGVCQAMMGPTLTCLPAGTGQEPGQGGQPPGGEGLDFASNLMFVPSTVQFNGLTWWQVGIRFKGNSSLLSSWQAGIWKLPFKLDFDEFEADYPEIENQRFYGFKQLSLSNGWSDDSLLHEKVMDDLFREADIPSPRAAFYRLYLDNGSGPVYFGLYTLVEPIENAVLDSQLGSHDGNLYKPEGEGATWGSFDTTSFEKENHTEEADWSDVQAAIAALHADRADAASWRAGLEATFAVDGFLRWLALNTLAVNWDTYGQMSHNYFLYADPADEGRLRWLPWDNSFALTSDNAMMPTLSISLEEVTDTWPLIRYLLDDPIYAQTYDLHLQDVLAGTFAEASVKARLQAAHDLIAPYVTGAEGEQEGYTHLSSAEAFDQSLETLFQHVVDRRAEAEAYLTP